MISMEVNTEVLHAANWCAPMVVVPKKNTDNVHICVDLSKLNKSAQQRYYPIQPISVTHGQIPGGTMYSKLDF